MAPKPEHGAWAATDLQRHYRAILDGAKRERQLVHDQDGSLFVIKRLEDADFEHHLVEHQKDVAQLMAVSLVNLGRPPSSWASQTPYPWIASLNAKDVAELQQELIRAHFHAAQHQDIEMFEGVLAAWHSTSEVKSDPAQMTATLDMAGPITEIFPPNIKQVEGAGGSA